MSPEAQEFHGRATELTASDLPRESFAAFEGDVRDILKLFGRMSEDERQRFWRTLQDVQTSVSERYLAEGKRNPALVKQLG